MCHFGIGSTAIREEEKRKNKTKQDIGGSVKTTTHVLILVSAMDKHYCGKADHRMKYVIEYHQFYCHFVNLYQLNELFQNSFFHSF
jgi:hypothetical protein